MSRFPGTTKIKFDQAELSEFLKLAKDGAYCSIDSMRSRKVKD